MDFQRLDRLAQEYMGKRKSHIEREIGHVYFHGKRVSNSVLLLRKRLAPEDDSQDEILRCAGLFHDIGKGIEPHPQTGAALAKELLRDEMTPSELEQVCALIAAHDSRDPENKALPFGLRLLQDADLLDHFGSQGLWLCFTYQAYMGQKDMMELPLFYETEWEKSLFKNRALLNFEISRGIFDEKAEYERQVISRLKKEGMGFYI